MSFKQWFRQIKKFPDWIYWLPSRIMMLLAKVMRHEIVDPNHYFEIYAKDDTKKAVVVIWHNRLLFFAPLCPKVNRVRTVAVISASRDGQYISDLVAKFGVRSVRGSTKKGAVRVLYDAFKSMKNGSLIAMTPDGPRGPKYHLSRGPIHLASSLGVPIVPIAVNSTAYWQLKSWDNFQIPKPWGKLSIVLGDEIPIPPDLTPEQFEEQRLKVEAALNAVSIDLPDKKSK